MSRALDVPAVPGLGVGRVDPSSASAARRPAMLSRRIGSRSRVACALLAALGLEAAFGAAPADPTRPPDAAFAAGAAASAPARARAPGDAASAPAPALPAPPVLQSIRLPRDGAPTALVNGQLLRVGDPWSGGSVTAIDRDGITLRGAKGTSARLSWAPGITKLASGSALPADDPRAGRLATSPPAAPPVPSLQPPVLAAGSNPR